MEAFRPMPLKIASVISSSPSPYAPWTYPKMYYRGDRVYSDPDDGGNGHNYECRWFSIGTNYRPEDYSYAWRDLGIGAFETVSLITSLEKSLNPDWVSGDEVSELATYFDPNTGHDYVAAQSISTSDNTIRPSTAVISTDVDTAARWVDIGPANALSLLDDEISTRSKGSSPVTMTLRAAGACDRLAIFGLRNAHQLNITVNALNWIEDSTFISSSFSGWVGVGATLTHNDPGITITNDNTATSGHAWVLISELKVGTDYTFTAAVTGTSSWRLIIADANQNTTLLGSLAVGSGTESVTFTAGTSSQYVGISIYDGFSDLDVTEVSLRASGAAEEEYNLDLEYGTSGRYKSRVWLEHSKVSGAEYQIELIGDPSSDVEIGLCTAGAALYIGSTETEVRSGGTQYHDIDEDEYGNTRFIPRTRKRQLTARIWLPDDSGDAVDSIMGELEGRPVSWNLNNGTTNIERLIIHGWAEDWETTVTSYSGNDYLSINPLKGLSE